MKEQHSHLMTVRNQFTRQADAYLRMKTVTDQKGLDQLGSLVEMHPEHRVLDVACGPGFFTMTLARLYPFVMDGTCKKPEKSKALDIFEISSLGYDLLKTPSAVKGSVNTAVF